MIKTIEASEIANYLQLTLNGESILIRGFSKLDLLEPNTVIFVNKFRDTSIQSLNNTKNILAIVTKEYDKLIQCSYIVSPNPRFDFIKVLTHFFTNSTRSHGIHHTAIVEDGAIVAEDAIVGPYCFISSSSVVGSKSILYSHVVVDNGSTIGERCEVKSGVVIGQSGFGFERYEDGTPIHFPHFGKVLIGDDVYIGANSTLDRGTLGDTIIENNVKIDNLVHIAHNCHIKEGAFVIAGTILSGGTEVGKNCWIAPNVSVKEKSRIGDESFVGIGSVVLRNVKERTVVFGSPASFLRNK